MKICALFGGPRKKGNTALLLEEVLDGARSAGHTVERIDVAGMDIHPCLGCSACKKPGATACVQKDAMKDILASVCAADLLIFASPMFWWNVAGPLKIVIDRFFALPFTAFAGKKVLLVMTTGQPSAHDGREGLERIFQNMCSFTKMDWLGTVTAGTNETPVSEQPEARKAARAVGENL